MGFSFAFVLPYGEPSDAFFPDTLLGQLCAEVRDRGHAARLLRVYYDGRDPARDAEVARRLLTWLEAHGPDLVVVERLFDPAPLRTYVERSPGRRLVLVSRGDSFDPVEGVDLMVGKVAGLVRRGTTRRSPTVAEVCASFIGLVQALERGADPAGVPGVAMIREGNLVPGPPMGPAPPLTFRPEVEHDTISLDPPPAVIRKTLFGNAGCPFAADPAENPHFKGLSLGPELARLGCAFCCMGGDYQKRPDDEVVAELVAQARHLVQKAPAVEELVLADQYPVRYLRRLIDAARAAGISRKRWLFACRADAFLYDLPLIEEAVVAAERTGHMIELYLTGFEALCDRELTRYNKGLSVEQIAAAVAQMRRLGAAHPGSFAYARARGHSLILWNPWTTPQDLAESVQNIRRLGLAELFHELGRNRLRLYRDLPLYWAAQRDGALLDHWEAGDEGAGHRQGYNVEHPWRFLDSRTREAWTAARALRDRLGTQTEVGQLAAVAAWAEAGCPGSLDGVLRGLAALDAALAELAGPRPAARAPRPSHTRAAVALFAGACDNLCTACANRDRWLDDTTEALLARVDEARASGQPVVFAGREPAVHPAFLAAVARARGVDGRAVGVVTNGRRFAAPGFAARAAEAGLRAASVKIFAPSAETADALTGTPGAFAEALAGVQALRRAGVVVEVRAPLARENLAAFADYAPLAQRADAGSVRIEAAVDAIGLENLDVAAEAARALARACAALRVPLEASPLAAGTRLFDRMPVPPPR